MAKVAKESERAETKDMVRIWVRKINPQSCKQGQTEVSESMLWLSDLRLFLSLEARLRRLSKRWRLKWLKSALSHKNSAQTPGKTIVPFGCYSETPLNTKRT